MYMHILRDPMDISRMLKLLSIGPLITISNDRDEVIEEQKAALEDALEFFNIRLNWASTNRIKNPDWFRFVEEKSKAEEEMTRMHRQGGAGALNIYTVRLSRNELGYSYFPDEWEKVGLRDGVFINYETVPGGDLDNYNRGKSAIHETGHWLGLYHTFQPHTEEKKDKKDKTPPKRNGCIGPGDYVDDTPFQKESTFGCPKDSQNINSCPDRNRPDERDPIHNYMNYSYDRCLNEFTELQKKRITPRIQWYRKIRPSKKLGDGKTDHN
ncbi:hypothetical protein H0H92_011573 [Tricholoma furcatifolium]|nr:hypothetical protein H0H92_011573 [Tricholoma furcatifolium]